MIRRVVCFKWNPLPSQKRSIPSQLLSGELKSPYSAWHVNNMLRMLRQHSKQEIELVCVTDDPDGIDSDVRIVPLWDQCRSLGGCYNRLYVFSKDMEEIIGPEFICLDLDVVITDNIDHLLNSEIDFTYYQAPGPNGKGTRFNCGFFAMRAGARDWVWEKFIVDPEEAMASCSHIAGTDQAWCNHVLDLEVEEHWDKSHGIYDMRQDFLETGRTDLPEDCCMVMWPGPRQPDEEKWRSKFPWIEKFYLQS